MRVRVAGQRRLAEACYLLCIEAKGDGWRKAVPGQFAHVRIEDSCDPLLRRPLSLHDVVPARRGGGVLLKIVYEVVGRGTGLLSEKPAGSPLDVLGPLGKGFDVKALAAARQVILVAGGMGVAPLYFLAKKLIEVRNPRSEVRKPLVFIGAKTKKHLIGGKMFKDLGCRVKVATDDGSKGHRGFVTQLLDVELRSPKSEIRSPKACRTSDIGHRTSTPFSDVICACGPKPMLAAVAAVAAAHGARAYVSLEEFMGCGLGACLGCVIKTTSGYRRICHDGPVFDSREIMWEDK